MLLANGVEVATSPPVALPPPPPPPETALTVVGSGTATTFSVALKNRLAVSYDSSGLILQSSSGPTSTGPWTATTASLVENLGCMWPQAQSRSQSGTKPADQRFIRLAVKRDVFDTVKKQRVRTTVFERFVELTPRLDQRLPISPVVKQLGDVGAKKDRAHR